MSGMTLQVARPRPRRRRLAGSILAATAAVLLGADGMIAGGPVSGIDEVAQFVADIEAQLPPAE